MKRLSLAVSALAFIGLAACSPKKEEAAAPAAPAAPAPAAASTAATPQLGDAATAAEIHAVFIIPGSEALFSAENAGTPPADEAAWKALEEAADKVIAGANLMKVGSRPQGREGWIAAADQVIKATQQTQTDLKARTVDNMVFTDGDMMTGCTACHQQFRDMKVPEGHLAEPTATPAAPAKPN